MNSVMKTLAHMEKVGTSKPANPVVYCLNVFNQFLFMEESRTLGYRVHFKINAGKRLDSVITDAERSLYPEGDKKINLGHILSYWVTHPLMLQDLDRIKRAIIPVVPIDDALVE